MMRAVLLDAYGHYSQAHEGLIAKPVPKAGEVLVQVESAVVGPYDYMMMSGIFGRPYPLPLIAGTEGAGTVVECGEGTEEWRNKRVQVMSVGMWAEYKLAKVEEVIPVLDNITFDHAATIVGNPATVLMFKDYILGGGHKAVVQNAANSALGKMLIRLCQRDGIPLINIVRSSDKADQLRAMGAEYVLDSSDPQFLPDYKALGNRLGATIAFDAVAGEMTGKMLTGLLPEGVVYVYGGLSEQPSSSINISDVMFMGKRIEGLSLFLWLHKKTPAEKHAIFQEIQLAIDTVFSTEFAGHYSMAQIQAALTSYKANPSSGKVLIHPQLSN